MTYYIIIESQHFTMIQNRKLTHPIIKWNLSDHSKNANIVILKLFHFLAEKEVISGEKKIRCIFNKLPTALTYTPVQTIQENNPYFIIIEMFHYTAQLKVKMRNTSALICIIMDNSMCAIYIQSKWKWIITFHLDLLFLNSTLPLELGTSLKISDSFLVSIAN